MHAHTYILCNENFLILPGCATSARVPYMLRGSKGSLCVVLKSLENDFSADALVPCFGTQIYPVIHLQKKKIVHSLPRSNLFLAISWLLQVRSATCMFVNNTEQRGNIGLLLLRFPFTWPTSMCPL